MAIQGVIYIRVKEGEAGDPTLIEKVARYQKDFIRSGFGMTGIFKKEARSINWLSPDNKNPAGGAVVLVADKETDFVEIRNIEQAQDVLGEEIVSTRASGLLVSFHSPKAPTCG